MMKLIVAFRNFFNTPKNDKNSLLFNIISHVMFASKVTKFSSVFLQTEACPDHSVIFVCQRSS